MQAAARRGIRTAIHEQNAFPGVTNKILAKQVDLVFAAMPDAVQRLGAPDKTVVTGNPVREEMFRQDRPAARRALGAKEGQAVIISFGGSLGAQVLVSEADLEAHDKDANAHNALFEKINKER